MLDSSRKSAALIVHGRAPFNAEPPILPDDRWNFKGYLSAAWHRVRVTIA